MDNHGLETSAEDIDAHIKKFDENEDSCYKNAASKIWANDFEKIIPKEISGETSLRLDAFEEDIEARLEKFDESKEFYCSGTTSKSFSNDLKNSKHREVMEETSPKLREHKMLKHSLSYVVCTGAIPKKPNYKWNAKHLDEEYVILDHLHAQSPPSKMSTEKTSQYFKGHISVIAKQDSLFGESLSNSSDLLHLNSYHFSRHLSRKQFNAGKEHRHVNINNKMVYDLEDANLCKDDSIKKEINCTHSSEYFRSFDINEDSTYERKYGRRSLKKSYQNISIGESNISAGMNFQKQRPNANLFKLKNKKCAANYSEYIYSHNNEQTSKFERDNYMHHSKGEFDRNKFSQNLIADNIDLAHAGDDLNPERHYEAKTREASMKDIYDKYSGFNVLKSGPTEFSFRQKHDENFECEMHEISLDNLHKNSQEHFKPKYKMSEHISGGEIINKQHIDDKESLRTPYRYFANSNIKKRSTVNTFTMHDATRITPLRVSPAEENLHRGSASDFEIIDDNSWFQTKRKCWAKMCWSRNKHSHALARSKYLHTLLEAKNRQALLNSMRTPQYEIKAQKKSCSEIWSSFLKGCLSSCQLWSRTLKKIEGQFGTGVVSYFVFLRWLILVNFLIFLLYFFLIILPYTSFSLLPHRNIEIAPNKTLLTEEYLQRFPLYKDVPYASKRTSPINISSGFDELLSNLGTIIDNNYIPDEVTDFIQYDKKNFTGEERKRFSEYCEAKYQAELANHTTRAFSFMQDFLQGTGWLQSTILFLGFYPDRDVSYFGLPYNLSVAFIAVLVASFLLSLVLMLQYSSDGIQENILTRKSNYLKFSNILFCSWDFCIEDKKTAAIRHKSITCEIKSNLAEEHRKLEVSHWSPDKRMKVYTLRVIINILVIAALLGCFYLIYMVVDIQLEKQRKNDLNDSGIYTLFFQFLSPLVITALNIIMPIIFYNVVKFEMYDTQTQVNIALFRIVFLRLASVFVLVSSLHQQITCEPKDVCKKGYDNSCQSPRCWETYVGQQLYKLVITDFLVYVFMFLGYDLPRDLIVRNCKCKVSEVVGRQVFDLPSQVLSLVYSQTLSWLGVFYSPLLPGITVLKFFIIFYIKKVVVLKHCVPAPVLYKASRSNSMFMTILMISLFFATVIHGYSLTSIEPSLGCSPFRQQDFMINAVAEAISKWSTNLVKFMSFLFSGFFFLPAFFLLSLATYYYWTIIVAQRKMFKILKSQIAIEGRDKQFLLNRLAEAARQVASERSAGRSVAN